MALIKTIINDKEVEVELDRWALDVACEMGIDIPTLCHHPALGPYGACRLCVVEVSKGEWTWLTTACDLPIREGLSIKTDTPAVIKSRQMVIELLWSRSPESKVLAQLAKQLGIEKPRFSPREELGKCILCGLCVRVCDKLIGVSAISFVNRGCQRKVGTPLDEASVSCIGCNACVEVCPTGHIVSVDKKEKRYLETWKTELEMIKCDVCSKAYLPKKEFERIQENFGEEFSLQKVCSCCRKFQIVLDLTIATAGK